MPLFTLITGASMGIGEAFVREFAMQGHNLVLVARSVDKLQLLAEELRRERGIQVEVCVMDLSENGAAESVYAFCCKRNIHVDVLVNCAGVSCAGSFVHIGLEKIEELVMVNMVATAKLTRLFVADMVSRKTGTVLNIASLGGLQGVPGLGLYSATKAFLITLSEALAVELQGKGVDIVVVCPGFIATTIFAHSGHNVKAIRLPLSKTDVVVKSTMIGLQKKQLRVFPTLLDRCLVFSQRFVSRKTAIRLAGFFAAVDKN